MSKTTALNIILGVLAVGLVAILGFLKFVDEPVAAPIVTTPATVAEVSTTSTTTSTTSTTSTSTATTTLALETTTTSSTFPVATTLVPPGERGFTGVLVVNGTSGGERLAPVVDRLRELGYADVRGVVGAVQAPLTSVYYVDGALSLAQRLATDLGFVLGEISIDPIADAPPVAGVGTAFVMVYLGPGPLPEPPPVTEVPVDTEPVSSVG